jgi:hypothetical protein
MRQVWYEGERESAVWKRVKDDKGEYEVPLTPFRSQQLRNHGDFNWGYLGSGPAQLALAILLDATGDPELALQHYQEFKFQVVANFKDQWSMSWEEIADWLEWQEATLLASKITLNEN